MTSPRAPIRIEGFATRDITVRAHIADGYPNATCVLTISPGTEANPTLNVTVDCSLVQIPSELDGNKIVLDIVPEGLLLFAHALERAVAEAQDVGILPRIENGIEWEDLPVNERT
jgi:hypothetical protein